MNNTFGILKIEDIPISGSAQSQDVVALENPTLSSDIQIGLSVSPKYHIYKIFYS